MASRMTSRTLGVLIVSVSVFFMPGCATVDHSQRQVEQRAQYENDWQQTKQTGTLKAYQRFLSKYPYSKYSEEATQETLRLVNRYMDARKDIRLLIPPFDFISSIQHQEGTTQWGAPRAEPPVADRYRIQMTQLVRDVCMNYGYTIVDDQHVPRLSFVFDQSKLTGFTMNGKLVINESNLALKGKPYKAHQGYTMHIVLEGEDGTKLWEHTYKTEVLEETPPNSPFHFAEALKAVRFDINDFMRVISQRLNTEKSIASRKEDVDGWGGVKWGMTEQEVAVSLLTRAERHAPKEYFGMYSTMFIHTSLTANAHQYRVAYLFENITKRLTGINITLDGQLGKIPLEQEYETLSVRLGRDYGNPDFVGNGKLLWYFVSTQIKLTKYDSDRSLLISLRQREHRAQP